MTIVLSWIRQSRNASVDKGRWSGTESWIVKDTTDQVITANDVYGGINSNVYFWGNEIGIPLMRWIGTTMQPIDGSISTLWSVTLSYESPTGDSGETASPKDIKQEDEKGFTSVESSVGSRIIDVWRLQNGSSGTALTFPNSGNEPGLTADIAGNKYDSNGDPISHIIPQITITIRNVISGRPNYSAYKSLVGFRNSAVYDFGESFSTPLGIGTTVFTGASASRIATNTYAVTWNFTWDEWYHLVQVPEMNPITNRPTYDSTVAAPNTYKADKVYWRQPFWKTGDFDGLGMVFT
jgi:hypothetical protein